jgi:hypothetical protein
MGKLRTTANAKSTKARMHAAVQNCEEMSFEDSKKGQNPNM